MYTQTDGGVGTPRWRRWHSSMAALALRQRRPCVFVECQRRHRGVYKYTWPVQIHMSRSANAAIGECRRWHSSIGVYIYVYIYMYKYTYTHTYTNTYTYVFIYTYVYMYMYIHMYMYTCTYVYLYTYTHENVYTYTCICIYSYT